MAKSDICEKNDGPPWGGSFKASLCGSFLITLLFLLGCSSNWQPKPHGYYPTLYRSSDDSLQTRLEQVVRELGIQKIAEENRVSIGLVNLDDIEEPEAAWINPDEMMYAASLPKIVILYGLIKQIESGEILMTKEVNKLAHDMIRYSSNTAASELYYLVGPDYLASLMRAAPHHLYNVDHGGGLWIGKGYEKGFAWCREPLEHLSHAASARAVARFYYLLETNQLFSPYYTTLMKKYMVKPGLNHKFVRGLEKVSPEATMYRKSGSWWVYHSDSALIESKGQRYIAVALFQDKDGSQYLEELIVRLEKIIQDERSFWDFQGIFAAVHAPRHHAAVS